MPLKVIDDFLPKDLAKAILEKYSNTQGCDRTNRTNWDNDIIDHSTVVLVNNIDVPVYSQLLQDKVQQYYHPIAKDVHFSTMFYRWTPFSYIPPHLDYHTDFAVSIHLNENYDPRDGGMFLYKNKQSDRDWIGIEPIFNRAVLASTIDEPDIMHQVAPVTSKSDRKSIQMFGSL